MNEVDGRDIRAQAIVEAGGVLANGVRSQADETVIYHTTLASCECTDWLCRHPAGGCKHMRALRLKLAGEKRRQRTQERPQAAVVTPAPTKDELRAQALRDLDDIWGAA